jgi:putative copper export protein
MLGISVEDVRVFLHVLAATVWVGGQLVLAALLPALRRASPDAPRAVARQFNRVAWPAFWVLVLTGAWNAGAEESKLHGAYLATFSVKLGAVVLSGAAAWLHGRTERRAALAVWGAVSALAALAALLLGVMLRSA